MSKLGVASVMLIGLLALTIFMLQSEEKADQAAPAVAATLPKVAKDAVDGLRVEVPGRPAVELAKTDGVWRIKEPLDATADQNVVDTALAKLAELEVVGTAATKEANHAKLEVDDKAGIHVIAKQGDKALIDAYVGSFRSGQTMVRQNGSAPTASVKGSIKYAFNRSVRDWRDRIIAKLEQDRIKTAVFENPKGVFKFEKGEDKWAQAAGEVPIEKFDTAKVRGIVSTVANLRAVEFAEAGVNAEQAGVGANAPTKLSLTLKGKEEGAADETLVFRVGNKVEANSYVKRDDVDIIYQVTTFTAERMSSGAEEFKATEQPEGGPKPITQPGPGVHALPIPGQPFPQGHALPPGYQQPPGH